MALERITHVTGRGVHIPGDDIDTDRIIPARYLKCVTFDGLGEHLFKDERFGEDGAPKEHPLSAPRFRGATILLTGANFGCGSSREHAPQALYRYGIRAVIAESFAEIFFGNAITLGMPCVELAREEIRAIAKAVEADPMVDLTIDLVKSTVSYEGKSVPAHLTESAREALVSGLWDPIAELLEADALIDETAAKLPYLRP